MPEIKTTPRDPRFPNTNQAQHCWTRYNEWVVCLKRTGSDEDSCKAQRQFAMSLCPVSSVEEWDEQRENGNFSGIQTDDDCNEENSLHKSLTLPSPAAVALALTLSAHEHAAANSEKKGQKLTNK
eukprot:CAMPEP_0171453126 /NCGR_PEP_ID=MMETSP0945-20130129/960_1 /TAXON_ID=109269 /ORGANISM="Vaucheria litorea, Strain CCMP2940" /LENGTH=124 /DNA_ID=CAMNT_0011977933 /DNA_START=91 /DNA_END=463 /DNA_ORIENTATION=-